MVIWNKNEAHKTHQLGVLLRLMICYRYYSDILHSQPRA